MLGLLERLKTSDFIFESKMVELNQNRNSKYLTLKMNQQHIQRNIYTCSTLTDRSKGMRKCPRKVSS